MSFKQFETEYRRLQILIVLAQDSDYQTNDAILRRALDYVGLSVSTDRLRVDLDWLAEQDLITVEVHAGLYLAKLTGRGDDVAMGRTLVSGVDRPRP